MHVGDRGQRMLHAAHVRARRLVADHEGVGLRAVQQARASRRRRRGGTASPGPRSRSQWSRRRRGREPFDRAGDEIRHHRVDRDAAAGDKHAGLAGGAEIRLEAARASSRFSSASAVYFLPTEQSVPTVSRRLPGRLVPLPVAKSRSAWRTSCSVPAAARSRPRAIAGIGRGAACRPLARSMPARAPRRATATQCSRQDAAGDWRRRRSPSCARRAAAASAIVMSGSPQIGLAARQAQLADAPVAPPVDDAVGGLGGELVGDVAEEQEIRLCDGHRVVVFLRLPQPGRTGKVRPTC